ncbi:MAG: Gldg family protein, partial [Gammaproteobacteria bacterium]
FQSSKENFLEYDLARLVYSLSNRNKPVIALYAGLPVNGGFNPATQQPTQAWAAIDQAEQLFDVRTLPEAFETIGDDVEVLWLIHPAGLSEASLYAIDQFVLRGGRMLAFVDPVAESAGGGNPMMGQGPPNTSSLEPLFSAWGVEFDPSQVTVDERLALSVNAGFGQRPIRHIGLLGLDESAINQEEIVTGGLASINVGVAGSLDLSDDSALSMTPLLSTSNDAAEIAAARFQFLQDPGALFDGYSPGGSARTIAARFSGPLESAFPEGSPLEGAPEQQHLGETASSNFIVVADVDLLGDRLWVQAQNFLGQQILTAFASNADFLVNALDNLSGSAELIGLRSRASFSRPFERVEELRLAADAQFRTTEQQLEAELDETESNLAELQAAREDSSSILMTPEQERELQRFLDQQVRIRRELRAVRLNLDRDIEQLGTLLKVANIGLVPLGILLFLLARVFIGRRKAP